MALLQFKQGFEISKTASHAPSAYAKILSWKLQGNTSKDCCSWEGVYCDQQTGHVDSLDLSSSFLYGSIDSESSLFPFQENLLKLETRNFRSLVGNLTNLIQLNLSMVNITSMVPASLNNLFFLSSLGLRGCGLYGEIPVGIFLLPNIQVLDVGRNRSIPATLTTLDLSRNYFSGKVPSLAIMSQLSYLSLAHNNFTNNIPASFANLTSLTYLDLNHNRFSGIVPSWFMNLTRLTHLDLSYNPWKGSVPTSLSQLENLDYLNLFHANLSGIVELDIFLSLKKLTTLKLSQNYFSVVENNKTNITLPQFKYLALSGCKMMKFPHFLQFQDELEDLFLDDNRIQGLIPEWIWNKSKEIMDSVWLGGNHLTGFEHNPGVLPWTRLRLLALWNNMMEASCIVLELSDSNFVGKIPSCLGNFSNDLMILDLKRNNFEGSIPEMSSRLKKVDLRINQFQGKLPRSLANCIVLEVLNLGENQIEDSFPLWLGTLPELQVLIVRSNLFHGTIENYTTNSEFPKLRIIDLYNNSFAGDLPLEHFQNCDAMKFKVDKLEYMKYHNHAINWGLDTLSRLRYYNHKQRYHVIVDLSSNKFTGKIPNSIESFKNLHSLNLSNNFLRGSIPTVTGNLTALESFDISKNNLTGKIPPQLAGLGFLAIFDMSFNHLTGPIPQGKQFNLFQNDSYKGNMALCGSPLSKKCGEPPTPSPPLRSEKEDDSDSFLNVVDVIIVSIGFGSGLIVGIIYGRKLATVGIHALADTFSHS
ncbi:receptor-like protein 6 [Apium graveolens]|uniref:receptor-like protein 6 n=1 Tax=Apium graveolens TaxID=4045 RepID=UPI003D7BB96C